MATIRAGSCISVVLKVALMMISLLAALNLKVQNRLARAGGLEDGSTPDAISISSIEKRQSVDDI
jgi:hypothetical protein